MGIADHTAGNGIQVTQQKIGGFSAHTGNPQQLLHGSGNFSVVILKKHLTVDSPYNTYKYKGLPPAPINVPPKACIDAVLNPENHKYIYFCASPDFDGTHRFAVSYSDHLKNARAFQRALTARKKAAQ